MPSSIFVNLPISYNDWTSNDFVATADGYINVRYTTTTSSGSFGIYLDGGLGIYESKHSEQISAILSVGGGTQYQIRLQGGTVSLARFYYSMKSAKKLGLL